MAFERKYQVKIPSKQLNKIKLFSTFTTSPVQQCNMEMRVNTKSETEINPFFLTGFTDAEGCFSIKIQQNAKLKTKEHLTSTTVFNQIIEIKSGMNLFRK